MDLQARTLQNPNKPTYIMAGSGEVVTSLEVEERANQGAHLFRELGLENGDHLAIFMENNRHFLEIISAASRSGLFYTTISTHLTVPEIEYIVADCSAKAFVTSAALSDRAAGLIDRMPNVKARLMVNGAIAGYESYEERIAAYPNTPIQDQMAGQDMLYSSGTTGLPKGVKTTFAGLSYGEVPDAGKLLIAMYGFNEDTVYLCPAPLYHAAPLRVSRLVQYAGGVVVVMEKFDAEQALAAMEKYKVTHSQWVPTMFIRMLKLPEEVRLKYDVSGQKMAIHAAAPIPIQVKEQMIDWWGPILFEYYAGTEGNGLTAIASEEWLKHKGSVGRALLGKARILNDDGRELGPGEIGTIYFSDGPEFEYHNDPEKTSASRSSQGWSTLNDVGYLDAEGFLYLTDRKTHMIISGGVNIYPQESENVLVMHPDVLDAAVIGVPHEDFGEEVKGVIELRDKTQAGPEMEIRLIDFCRSKLAKIKCPASIDFVDELPRTPTGKLLKRILIDEYKKKYKQNAARTA